MGNNKELISRLKKRDISSLDELTKSYSNLIYKVSYGVLNNVELSKDCLNEVLLKIWDNAKYFNKDEEKFPVWIMAISKYTAIDILRKEAKHSKNINIEFINESASELISESIERQEKVLEVKEKINEMKEIDREIFLRKFFKDEDTKDISKDLGVSEKFINLRIFRGRKRLMSSLKEEV